MSLLQHFKNLKLRAKVIIPISLLVIASIATLSVHLIRRQADAIRSELETSGETMIRMLAMEAESGVFFESKTELDEMLAQLHDFGDVVYAGIATRDGRILTTLGSWNDAAVAHKSKIDSHCFDEDSHGREFCNDYYVTDIDGNDYIELNYIILSRTEEVARENLGLTSGLNSDIAYSIVTEDIGTVRLILSLEKVNLLVDQATMTSALLTVVVLILTIIMLTLLIQFITKPLDMLVKVTDQVSRGDLEQRLEIDQEDEIGHLARTFNRMIESLKQSRDEIEEYNRNLEQKIIERTLALEDVQSQLVQSEKMSAIGQLAAGVAHELNNPLGGILGYAQFALEKMKKQESRGEELPGLKNYIRYLEDIESQSRRCKNIVQNLLRFSRSSCIHDFDDLDINQIISETCTFVEHQLHMNQIDLVVDLAPDIPSIFGNAGQLQQVFTNMIINAMHASQPDSVVTIKTMFSPALGEFGGTIEVAIIDQGAGIAAEIINKIFEPFFTTKEVGKGTGLGLSVSYGIIKDHGGEIKVDSEVGKGTTFSIILPIQKPLLSSDNQQEEFLTDLTD